MQSSALSLCCTFRTSFCTVQSKTSALIFVDWSVTG